MHVFHKTHWHFRPWPVQGCQHESWIVYQLLFSLQSSQWIQIANCAFIVKNIAATYWAVNNRAFIVLYCSFALFINPQMQLFLIKSKDWKPLLLYKHSFLLISLMKTDCHLITFKKNHFKNIYRYLCKKKRSQRYRFQQSECLKQNVGPDLINTFLL